MEEGHTYTAVPPPSPSYVTACLSRTRDRLASLRHESAVMCQTALDVAASHASCVTVSKLTNDFGGIGTIFASLAKFKPDQ